MDLNLIPLKHSLKQTVKYEQISNIIAERIKAIPELENNKLNMELIHLIANLIEYYVKHKYHINKETLLIFSLKKSGVSLTEDEEKVIKDIITYLHNNKLIKHVSKVQYVLEYSKNILKKQL